ncbi:adenosine deaminase family protein [Rhodocista pekingensis]|uniref:adenosine deaminase n=1 Tax=Rhodocista pekingensis TaxID=201185 RepID=A0ABW2L0D2_9PROT
MRRALPLLLLLSLLTTGCAALPERGPTQPSTMDMEAVFDAARTDAAQLTRFLTALPKGADLHSHLSGAVYAESFVTWAQQDGLCFDRAARAILPPPCRPADGVPAVADHAKAPGGHGEMLNALSIRGTGTGMVDGRDQFFSTFGRFGAVSAVRTGDMLAEVARIAADEHILHLEEMLSLRSADLRALAATLRWSDDLDAQLSAVRGPALDAAVTAARADLDRHEARQRAVLGCGPDGSGPAACAVGIRYILQANRSGTPAEVFVQAVFAATLAGADPRVVGLNLVAPEDGPSALRDFDAQMRVLGFVTARFPHLNLALHAGELTPVLAPPAALRDHITKSVAVAGADRIGHGAAIAYETDAAATLDRMARERIPVEVLLTSNEQILHLDRDTHPFRLYRAHGVPLVLATDDQGVSRSTLALEYVKAVRWFGLDYATVKRLSRDSLRYSFLPGDDLWADAETTRIVPACAGDGPGIPSPGPACAGFLAGSEKARTQWRLEAALAAFEAAELARHR